MMRHTGTKISALLLTLLLAAAAGAQMGPSFGKSVAIQAGSPEDRALLAIDAATDPAAKLELLAQFIAEYGDTDLVLVAYERYVALHVAADQLDKAGEYAQKALVYDPDNFMIAFLMFRGAHQKGDLARLVEYGRRIGEILQRFHARPAPDDMTAETWEQRKQLTLEQQETNINYVQYTFYSACLQTPDPTQKAQNLEAFLEAFPDSPYGADAPAAVAAAYLEAQNFAKMIEFADRALQRKPENVSLLVVVCDTLSDKGEQLDKAEEAAKRAIALLEKAEKPEALTAEQWEQRRSLQLGIAHSALGQVYILKNRDAPAVEAFRAAQPLLKGNDFYNGRNLYRLGFVLANRLRRTAEARTVLTEAVAVNSPYKALAQQELNRIAAPARRRP